MSFSNAIIWLRERTVFNRLSPPALRSLAQSVTERVVPAQQQLVQAGTPVEALYILQAGQLEGDGLHVTDAASSVGAIGWLPGAAIHLQELLLGQPAQRTLVAQTECRLWEIPIDQFRSWIRQYPEVNQIYLPLVAQELAQDVAQLSTELTQEQERQAILRPYLVSKAKRGVVGKSRYAVRLRHQIQEAAAHRQAALVFGEPGLEKGTVAALIHFSGPDRRTPIAQIDCSIIQESGAELFGRVGGKPGLIAVLGKGTLILNNIQELPQELLPKLADLLRNGTYRPTPARNRILVGEEQQVESHVRIILVSEKALPEIDSLVPQQVKVPPLRVRKADIDDWAIYYFSLICRARGIPRPTLTPEALRRLQAYDFPNNLKELQSLLERAIVQAAGAPEITEELVWPSQTKKKQFRLNLLNANPWLRDFLRSDWWPNRINYGFTLPLFAFVVAVGLFGPQTRQDSFVLNLFWAWWWPLILIAFPFVGRLWCAVCPFMIYGELAQKISLWLWPRSLQRWPRKTADRWGGWFLFSLFALIFLWEELWDLENTAYLSAWLLLLITAGAVICSLIFERRFWCRYLCPIGGMNGLFAKLSMTELRAQQGTCSAECTTYQCYKGGPEKGEGMDTDGCPLYSHPAQLTDNRDCVLCMTCLKACPHRSVEVNLRPPGIELWTSHTPRTDEVALLLLLLGGIFLHRLPELQMQLGLTWDLNKFGPHLALSMMALALPSILPLAAYGGILGICQLRQRLKAEACTLKPQAFVALAYGYLPLVLFGTLAHYLRLGLTEGGRLLPVTLATFGLNGTNLPVNLPVLVAHPAVIAFLQGISLLVGLGLSMVLTQKIARQDWRSLLPQQGAIVLLTVGLWQIIVGT